MPIGIPVFFFETARTSLSAMVGGGGSRLAGGSRRCARLPACWLSAAARGLAIGRGSGQTATTPYAESRAHRRKTQPLARKAASRAHRRQRKASREPPPPTIADSDVRAVFRTGHWTGD